MESEKPRAAVVWRERIERQQCSGESIKAWCLANGYQQHSFYSWRTRLGLSPRPSRVRRRKPRPVLTEVMIGGPRGSDVGEPPTASLVESIRLRLPGGRELVLPMSMSDERLATLIGLIEGRR